MRAGGPRDVRAPQYRIFQRCSPPSWRARAFPLSRRYLQRPVVTLPRMLGEVLWIAERPSSRSPLEQKGILTVECYRAKSACHPEPTAENSENVGGVPRTESSVVRRGG